MVIISLSRSNSYKNLENTDLSRLPEFQRHVKDTGSPEYQVARLNARVAQVCLRCAGREGLGFAGAHALKLCGWHMRACNLRACLHRRSVYLSPQLAAHLKVNKKDYSALRGLQQILAQRKSMLQYLYRKDRER